MEYIVTLIFLIIGFMFGKLVLEQGIKNYDMNLLILAVIFFVLGSNTVVFSTGDFKIMLSNIVPSFLLGVLVRRFMNKYGIQNS